MFEQSVVFHSQGVPLVGRFFRRSDGFDERQPAVIAMGSWLTVKEQMATTYARAMAELGYTAFVFDFAGFGESRGEPRQAEMPSRKIGDIFAAVDFLRTLSFVDPERIACLSICASAQYTLTALARGLPIRSFASVAGWYHDAASVAPFYGGPAGVAARLLRASAAIERYAATNELLVVPAYEAGNERAGMHFPLDYYANAERGALPAWKNQMAEMTWFYWFAFDGLAGAERVTTPSLFVHSDDCVFPETVKKLHERVRGPKELVWGRGSQIDFYDQPAQVSMATAAVHAWFEKSFAAGR